MSSPAKDARWQLAADMLQNTSFDSLNDLPYPVTEAFQRIAQSVLECLPPGEIDKLSKIWNDQAPPSAVQKLPYQRVDYMRLRELIRLNESGAEGTYIISTSELREIFELAELGLEYRSEDYSAEKVSEKKILKTLARLIKEEL